MNFVHRLMIPIVVLTITGGHVAAQDVLAEADELVLLVQVRGIGYMNGVSQPAFAAVPDPAAASELRLDCARRLGAILHCEAIPVLLKNQGLLRRQERIQLSARSRSVH